MFRHVCPAPGPAMGPADDPVRPEEGRQPEGVWKTAARDVALIETVNSILSGSGPASRSLPDLRVSARRAFWHVPSTSPGPGMNPRRRLSRRRSDRLFAHTVQRIRLEAIARGEIQPLSLREFCFQWRLQDRGHVHFEDFIVSWPLLEAEMLELGGEEPSAKAAIGDARGRISGPPGENEGVSGQVASAEVPDGKW